MSLIFALAISLVDELLLRVFVDVVAILGSLDQGVDGVDGHDVGSSGDADLACGQPGATLDGAAAKVMICLTDWGKRYDLARLGI